MNPRVKEIEIVAPYKMVLTFTNNEIKEFDFASYLHYPVFTPLQNVKVFDQATIFNGTICWNNDIDFDPDTLYLESKGVEQLNNLY